MSTREPPPNLKQAYYDQQLLKLADFERERDYHVAWREFQTQLLCTPGILTGLVVRLGASAAEVVVEPGAAVDRAGRIIALTDKLFFAGNPTNVSESAGGFRFDFGAEPYVTLDATRTFRLSLGFHEEAVAGAPNTKRQAPVLTATELGVGTAASGSLPIADVRVTAVRPRASVGAPAPAPPEVHAEVDSTVGVASVFDPSRLPPLAVTPELTDLRSRMLAIEDRLGITTGSIAPSVKLVPVDLAPPAPDGLKLTVHESTTSGVRALACPVLTWGAYSIWPFSYANNRMALAMVAFDSANAVRATWEKTGARYIVSVTIDESTQTVTFVGQAGSAVAMRWTDFAVVLGR